MANALAQYDEAMTVWTATRALLPEVEKAGALAVDALRAGHTLYSAGNGGSSADALHFAEEFTGRYRSNRRPLPALCLAADAPALTCIANDFGYDAVFSRQLEAFGRPGDVFFAFSTSGNSPNVLAAFEVARRIGVGTVLLTGETGGQGAALADHVLRVPSRNTARIQEVHGFYLHVILEAVEAAFPIS
jgi:D-sedoheptulose 7-phosphate isomerase